jgi:NitT/TauT family transport system substrate-binding protein
MSRSTMNRVGALLGGAAIACAALAAPVAAQSAAPAGELKPVSLQLEWVEQAQFAGFYVARDKGYCAEEGLDLTILPGGPNVRSIQQVASGAATFGLDSSLALYQARDAGIPVVLVAQPDQKDGFVKIAFKDAGITEPAEFAGKTVGVWPDEYEFYPLMASVGIDPDSDLTLVQQAFTMDAFLNRELDVASATLWNEYNVVLESGVSPDDLTVWNYSDYGFGIPHGGIITLEETLANDRETVVSLVRCSIRGWLDAYANPDEAIDIVMNYVLEGTEQSGREHQEKMLAAMKTLQLPEGFPESDFGKPNPEFYATAAAIAEEYDLVNNEPIDVESGYDLTVWEEAAAGL